jgi:hypothetical protein
MLDPRPRARMRVREVRMKHMAFRILDGWVIAVHDGASPGSQWSAYLQALDELFTKRQVARSSLKIFVYTEGGGPNAAERKALNDLLQGIPSIAVVTQSTQVRLIINALSLFSTRTRMFSPLAVRDALSFLKATDAQQTFVWQQMRHLQRAELPHVRLPELASNHEVHRA